MLTVSSIARIPSTAAWSAASLSPRPIQRAAPIAAASVTRTSSSARFRSGGWADDLAPFELARPQHSARNQGKRKRQADPGSIGKRAELHPEEPAVPAQMHQPGNGKDRGGRGEEEAEERRCRCSPEALRPDALTQQQADHDPPARADQRQVPPTEVSTVFT